ncbi:MAG: alpha-2-macroglobulin family protein, partial [Bacteroidales bacterium]
QKGEQYDPLQGKEHKWDKVKAKEYCEAAISAYPGSHGAKQCRVLLEKLLKPGFSLEMDYACIPNSPSIASLQYKNTDKVFLSLYEIKHSQWEELNRRGREKIREALKNRDAIKNWHISPEDDKDLQQHRVEVDIPALATGHYVLLASSDHDLETDSANSIYNSFFVTDLSLYMHSLNHEKHEGYVSGLRSGKPVEEAEIRLYKRDYDYNSRSYRDNLIKKIHTDKDGYFNVPAEKDKTVHYRVALRKEDDHYVVPERFSLYGHRSQRAEKERIKTYLYTDRAIYRPGQKVYFKGIVLGFRGDDHKIREDFSASIKLMDVNGEQVERIDVQTNEYGSFNGSFVLPSSGLTGRFQLRGEHGSKTIRVEEYKRPRFEVELQQVEEPFRLGDEVVMKGKATAYAGNSISDARVRYEVKRKPEYEPLGYGYGFFIPRPSQGEEVTVSHGEVKTDEQGNFDISFIAVPGERKGEHINTIFRYKVTADVTGISGETRSDSRTVSAGEKALLLDINIPEKVEQTEPMVYRLKTENLDGAQVPAEGELKIERLKQPKRLLKNRRWDVPDKYVLQKQEFVEKFPHEQYKTELDKPSWKTEEEVFGCEFNTKKTDSMIMNCAADWEEGVYRITITSRDIFGRRVKKEKYFTLYDPQSKKMPEKTWLWTEINKSSAEPGEEVELIVGSAAKDAKVRFSYGMNGKLLHDEQITLSENKQKLSIPVKESWRGGFFIYLMMTKEGVVYHKEYRVAVPYTNKKLETQLLTFRDKLKPGSSESWKLRLRGPEGETVAAEMLASMYDASLDQFVTHKWGFDYLSNNYAGRRKLTPSGRSSSSAYLNMTHRKYHMPQGLKMEQFDHFQIHMQRHKFGLSNSGDLNMVMEAELQEMPMIDRDNEKPEGIFMKKKIEDTVPQTDGEASPKVRTDFSETAFFYPSLETDKNGDILLEFTMPEAVTRWNLMTLSHSRDLKSDILTRTVQTQKELMVMPNMPRFLRESDTIIVSSTISNLSEDTLTGQARIKLF